MRKVDVAVAAVVVAATATATVVLPGLDDDKPDVLEAPTGEVVEIYPNGQDRGPVERDRIVVMDPDEPLVCMTDLDCLLHEVEVAAGIVPAAVRPPALVSEAAPPSEPAP